MVKTIRKVILIVGFFLLVAVIGVYVFYIKTFNFHEEFKTKYDIPGSNSYIRAYKSTPEIVISKTQKFLKENGFCGDNIEFTFGNKYYSSKNNDDFTFHVECYCS